MSTASRLPQRADWLDGQWPVVIAVAIVPVVQSPINEAISVIAVRDDLMPTTSVVAATTDGSAVRRVRRIHSQYVFIVMVVVNRVEMPIVQVVVVVAMRNAQVTARLTVDVGMPRVCVMTRQYTPPFQLGDFRSREWQSQVVSVRAHLTTVLTLCQIARRRLPRTAAIFVSYCRGWHNS
jgi:hypothetical protein